MRHRKFLFLAALAGWFTLAYAVSGPPSGQSPVRPSGQTSSQGHAGVSSNSKKLTPAANSHNSLAAAITKVEILPSSISIMGPRYRQRLLVEGTFADGHQEELTSRAKVTISDLQVAQLDQDNFVFPQGDGKTTITATVLGR
ncbi:MAG: hypothetical protein ABR956_16090, partial [Terracidiphilus sp.]